MSKQRISVELETENQRRFINNLPHGFQKLLYLAITDLMIEMQREGGFNALSMIVGKSIKLSDIYED